MQQKRASQLLIVKVSQKNHFMSFIDYLLIHKFFENKADFAIVDFVILTNESTWSLAVHYQWN